jgi:hypothetical protein
MASAVRGESFAEPLTSFAVSTDKPGQFGAIPLPQTAPTDTACDEVCMGELRRCCCPGWKHYATFDVLFLQRNNQSGGQPLVVDAAGAPILTAQSLQPSIGSGVRLFYGQLMTDSIGWEVGYLGIYRMFGQATAAGNATLNAPGPLGVAVNNFSDADTARATYWSTLNMAEANVLNTTLIYKLTDTCGIRAGYNAIWLTNAALAPTQFDFSTGSAAGTGLNDNGGIFLHGANLGVETRW